MDDDKNKGEEETDQKDTEAQGFRVRFGETEDASRSAARESEEGDDTEGHYKRH